MGEMDHGGASPPDSLVGMLPSWTNWAAVNLGSDIQVHTVGILPAKSESLCPSCTVRSSAFRTGVPPLRSEEFNLD